MRREAGAGVGPSQHAPPATEFGNMERRPFGLARTDVAAIGQGTWYIDDGHRPTAVEALRGGLDLGMTHIDTAELCVRIWSGAPLHLHVP
jgi:hypothetical protein